MEKRDRIIELLTAVRYTTNDIEKVADEICLLFDVEGRSEQFYCFEHKNKRIDSCVNQCDTCKELKLMQ